MKKIQGIKSVDFKIEASGFGVVNWNSTASINSKQAGKVVNNHSLPKMRGVDIFKIKSFDDINDNVKLYISQNCIRQALFKDYTYALKEVTLNNVEEVLLSLVGLIRGYVIAKGSTSLKRKSSLFLEDFIATDDVKLNYEQYSTAIGKNETSMFSKHTTGKTKYTAYGSINIEDLEFLPLEDSLSRSCYREIITEKQGEELAEKLTQYLKNLDFSGNKNPKAQFANNYVRINAISQAGEAGILLNNDAIELLTEEMLELIKNLFISRTRAYVKVDELLIDYNDGQTMRIKKDISLINKNKEGKEYAMYYEAKPYTADEYNDLLKKRKDEIEEATKKNKKEANKSKEVKE